MELYHLAPTSERERIQAHGIIASDPRLHEQWGYFTHGWEYRPPAIYALDNVDSAHALRTLYGGASGDIWRIVTPLNSDDVMADPYHEGGFMILRPQVDAALFEPFEDSDIAEIRLQDQAYEEGKQPRSTDWRMNWGYEGLDDIGKSFRQWGIGLPNHVMGKTANIMDPIHDELDQTVFAGIDPRPSKVKFIRDHFMDGIQSLVHDPEHYFDLYLTGSLTTYQYSDESDADVSVFPKYDELATLMGVESADAVRKLLITEVINHIDGAYLPGTTHPLQHFVVLVGNKPEDLYRPGLRSAWDFQTRDWLVPPEKERTHNVMRELPLIYLRAHAIAEKMRVALSSDPDAAKRLFKRIHIKRTNDQRAGRGDFSEGNIVYKYLLHEGLFDQLRNIGIFIAKIAWTKEEIERGDHRDPEKRKLKERAEWPTEPTGDWANYVEHVPTDVVAAYAEYDRRPGGSEFDHDHERWEALKEHIRQHGVNTPIMMDYNPDTHRAHISEGNHRVQIAMDVGIPHVPVVLYRSTRPGKRDAETPLAVSPEGQYIRPSDVGFEVRAAKLAAAPAWTPETHNETGMPRPMYDQKPVPWTSDTVMPNAPDFSAIDTEKQYRAWRENLCVLCGDPLTDPVHVFGTPDGTIVDGGLHPRCARMTAVWCPHVKDGIANETYDEVYVPLDVWLKMDKPDAWPATTTIPDENYLVESTVKEAMPPASDEIQVIYDFNKDRIILGTRAEATQLPNTVLIGVYRDGNVTMYEAAHQWINTAYFKKLWLQSYPDRPLHSVHLHSEKGRHRVGVETPNQRQRAFDELSESLGPDQSEIVHEWSDGWTVRNIETVADKHREGVMQRNCWRVNGPVLNSDGSHKMIKTFPSNGNRTYYYSLRDPNNLPVASFHIYPDMEEGHSIYNILGPRNKALSMADVPRLHEFAEAKGYNIGDSYFPTAHLSEQNATT
jgi:hypothetical protein